MLPNCENTRIGARLTTNSEDAERTIKCNNLNSARTAHRIGKQEILQDIKSS